MVLVQERCKMALVRVHCMKAGGRGHCRKELGGKRGITSPRLLRGGGKTEIEPSPLTCFTESLYL